MHNFYIDHRDTPAQPMWIWWAYWSVFESNVYGLVHECCQLVTELSRLSSRVATLAELLFPVLPTFITFSFVLISPRYDRGCQLFTVKKGTKYFYHKPLQTHKLPCSLQNLCFLQIKISLYLLSKTIAKFKKITDLVNY